jgi:hypothetical protein
MNDDNQCEWGRKIKAEFAAQQAPTMPLGWTRVFEEHWSCTPAFMYFVPGTSDLHPERAKDRYRSQPVVRLTVPNGIEFFDSMLHMYGYVDRTDYDAVMVIVREDEVWLRDFDRRHGLECTHGQERSAEPAK